jgi:uncharacterized protein
MVHEEGESEGEKGIRDLRGQEPAAEGAQERAPRTSRQPRVRIGVIADAHGYLDPRVTKIFAGVDHILVAGDVLDQEILEVLTGVAPVTAVWGASDGKALVAGLPREAVGDVRGVSFVVGHDSPYLLSQLSHGRIWTGPQGSLPDLVVSAGTHAPSAAWIEGTLFLNPGTAGSPEREDNDPTVALVERLSVGLAARFIPLRRRPAQKPLVRRKLEWGLILPHVTEREVKTPPRKRGPR